MTLVGVVVGFETDLSLRGESCSWSLGFRYPLSPNEGCRKGHDPNGMNRGNWRQKEGLGNRM